MQKQQKKTEADQQQRQPLPQLLSARQVAAALSVSVTTVYAMMDRGEVVFLRVARNRRRVRREDLDAYLQARLEAAGLGEVGGARPRAPYLEEGGSTR